MTAHIGSRWTPNHVKRRDTSTGAYEEVNASLLSRDELRLQAALLKKSAPRRSLFSFVTGIR